MLPRQQLSAIKGNSVGSPVRLYGVRRPEHPLIQRVTNWTEVEEALARLGAAQEAGALHERQ